MFVCSLQYPYFSIVLLSIHVFNIRSCSLEVDISVQIDIVPRLFRLRGDNIGAGERDLV